MTNADVIQALQEYIQINRRLETLSQQKTKLEKKIKYYQIEKKPPKAEKPPLFSMFLLYFTYSLGAAMVLIHVILDIPPEELSLIWSILGAFLVSCVITIFKYRKERSKLCAKYVTEGYEYNTWKEERKELPSLETRLRMVTAERKLISENLKQAKLRKILHPDYLNYAETLLGYFQRGRVRDLRDAINLLEQELRERSRDIATEAYHKQMKQQAYAQTKAAEEAAEQSRRAAAAAEEAAFWGSAATFVAATNSKKSDNGDYHVV